MTLIHILFRVRVRAWVLPPLTAVAAVPVEAVAPAREERGALGGTACGPRRAGGTPGPLPTNQNPLGVTEFYLSLHVVDRKKST